MDYQILQEQYASMCRTLEIYKGQLKFKDKQLKKANKQINLLKGLLQTLRDDLNLKNEQFDYLFKGIFTEQEERETIITEQNEKFRKSLETTRPNLSQKFGYFKFLPQDVLVHIACFLEYDDLSSLGQVNHDMVVFCTDNAFWKPLYDLRWKTYFDLSSSWYDDYRSRHVSEMNWFYRRPVISTLPAHTGAVTSISVVDSRRFISSSDDGSAVMWTRPDSPECTQQYQHHKNFKAYERLVSFYGHGGPIWCTSITPTEKLATGSYDKTIKLWNLDNGKWENTLRGHEEWVSCIDCQDHVLYSGSWDACIMLWDLNTKQPLQTLATANGNAIYCLQPWGTQVISGGRRHTIDNWDTVNRVVSLQLHGHSNVINCIQRNENTAISGSADSTSKLWDLRTGHWEHTLKSHTSHVMCLQFDMDSNILATGSYDHTIHIWDSRKLEEPRRVLEGHSTAVFAMKFDVDRLISGSGDKTVRIWSY